MTRDQVDFIDELARKNEKLMVQVAYRHTGDLSLAEDLAQETLLIACCKAGVVCGHENPTGWLYSTMSNLIMREMDKAYRSAEVPLLAESFYGASEDIELGMDFYLPEGLSNKERDLILMRVDRHMSYAEIADLGGITEVACRQQLSRALRKCRQLKEKEFATQA